jgi:hypothetical protein
MDLTGGSETSAKINLTPGKYPKKTSKIVVRLRVRADTGGTQAVNGALRWMIVTGGQGGGAEVMNVAAAFVLGSTGATIK